MAAGAKDMSQVPVQWGVHEDVFCAVRCCFSETENATMSLAECDTPPKRMPACSGSAPAKALEDCSTAAMHGVPLM